MRIIIIHDNASISGGAQKVAITEAIALKNAGYDVCYFSAVGPIYEGMIEAGIRVICLNQVELKDQLGGAASKIKGIFRGLWNREAFTKLREILKEYDPKDTIVHIHGWSLALSPSVFKAASERKFKVALTCHDYEIDCPTRGYFNYQTNQMCKLKGMSKECIKCDCDKRSKLQKQYRVIRQRILYHNIEKTNLSLIYLSAFNKRIIERDLKYKLNGYIVPNLIDIPLRKRVNTDTNSIYLYIGRLNPEKGGRLFCESVTRAHVNAEVIGAGADLEILKKEYPNIVFHGWKTPAEMVPIITRSRCYIMSSICYEGAPLTIPEIQCAYAMPCIVPSPSGAVDYIKNGVNGLIYENGNIEELIGCIEKMKDDGLVQSMTSYNRENIDSEQYSETTHVNNLIEAYKHIMG